MTRLRTRAAGKVNLCLYVGEPRDDGYHPLASVFQAVDLADTVTLEPALDAGADEVVCAGVDGPNLAARALAEYRAASGYDGPPVRILIEKRIPVAAGMGGGSADAAAALRLIAHRAGDSGPLAAELAPALGADVPFALHGGRALVTGIGERVAPLCPGPPGALVVVPSPHRLATPAVYRQADALGSGRPDEELTALTEDLRALLAAGDAPPAINDLEPAARALCPPVAVALAALSAAGAASAIVSGSGPTVFGRAADLLAAERIAARLRATYPGTVACRPAPPGMAAIEAVA